MMKLSIITARALVAVSCLIVPFVANTRAQEEVVDLCCCGDEPAVGPCCQLTKHAPLACEVHDGEGTQCQFAQLGIGGDANCPSTSYKCPESVVCPPVTSTPSPTASPTLQPPSSKTSCSVVWNDEPVNSDDSCQRACMAFGLFCAPYNNVSVCGSRYTKAADCNNNEFTECDCGSSYLGKPLTKLCTDQQELPPTCDRLSTPEPIDSAENCENACKYYGVFCVPDQQDGSSSSSCGSQYTMTTSDSPPLDKNCFCGPEGMREMLCGNGCTTSDAPFHLGTMEIVGMGALASLLLLR